MAVIDAVGRIAPTSGDAGGTLKVRIGIAAGLVVVGEMTGAMVPETDAVVGETPNLAARLQSIAKPGTIVISDDAHELVGGVFEYKGLGSQRIEGFPEPLPAWRVLHETHATNRFEILRGRRMTKLVSREEEVRLLQRRWRSAVSGTGAVVIISGDAGIGKSRIAQTLRTEIATDAVTSLQYQCSQFHEGTAFAPIIGHIEHAAGFLHGDASGVRTEKLRTLLEGRENEVLAALLRLPSARPMSEIEPDPELRRERVLEALMSQLEHRCTLGPILVVFEDLHWSETRRILDSSYFASFG